MSHPTDDVAGTAAGQAGVLARHAQYLIATAARAPSVHNSQPWGFRVGPRAVELWCDPRRKVAADAIGREMLISCGAALFGLRLAVRSLGFQPVVDLLPDRSQLRLMARVSIGAAAPMNALERQMLAAVPHRHTHRGPFLPGPLPAGLLAGLQNDALTEGASLAFVEAGLPYYRLAEIAAAAARRGEADPRARAEHDEAVDEERAGHGAGRCSRHGARGQPAGGSPAGPAAAARLRPRPGHLPAARPTARRRPRPASC